MQNGGILALTQWKLQAGYGQSAPPKQKGELIMARIHLLPILIGAAVGVGTYVVGKYLTRNDEDEEIVEDSAFDEAAGSAAEEPAAPAQDAADSSAEPEPAAQTPAPEPLADAPAEEAPEETASAYAEATEPGDPVIIPISDDDTPNLNPVKDASEPAKTDGNGKLDPTTIARAEDFADWDETGCKG